MKYSLEGFLQNKLVELSLGYDDALILRWLIDFAACGKMKRLIKENDDHEKNVYYWVNYQAIVDEFPCMQISSVKTIQRKFAKYVELGLLDKLVYSGGSNGLQSFYAINKKLLELEYSSTPAAPKIIIQENKIKNNKASSKNAVLNKEEVENNEKAGVDKNVQSENSQFPEWTKMSSPEVPLDKNVQSGVDKNVQSVYINSSTKNSSTTLSNPSAKPEAAEREKTIRETIKSLFENSLALFSDDLIPKVLVLTEKLELRLLSPYVKYVYQLAKAQNPKKLHGLFYKLVCQHNSLEAFTDSLSGSGRIQQKWKCPVCKAENIIYEDCKVCGTQYNLRKNNEHLAIKRQIYFLPEERKNKFNEKMFRLAVDSLNFADYKKEEKKLYQEFGIKA